MQQLIVYFTRHLQSFRQATTQTGSLQEKERRSVVFSFTFAALIRPWIQTRILKGVRRNSLKNPTDFSSTHVRISVKDATPLRRLMPSAERLS